MEFGAFVKMFSVYIVTAVVLVKLYVFYSPASL